MEAEVLITVTVTVTADVYLIAEYDTSLKYNNHYIKSVCN